MKTKLTLQEKLRDLRAEKGLTLAQVSEKTFIPKATLQRLEGMEEPRNTHQDIVCLANFYGVSLDYLFGATNNRDLGSTDVNSLGLADNAIALLTSGRVNNRLISELLSHPDFADLLCSMEIYIDQKITPQTGTLNAFYKLAESAIKKNFETLEKDEYLRILQEAIIDENDYLLFKISERFNAVMKSLHESHKKDASTVEYQSVLQDVKDGVEVYFDKKENSSDINVLRAKFNMLAKQLGLNTKDLTDEERKFFMRIVEKSNHFKSKRRKS